MIIFTREFKITNNQTMNIFAKKLEEAAQKEVTIEPIELFQSLFHKEGYSYLRGIQEEVLKMWHDIRSQRDVMCKMNTGSGKTLVSLLMLHSKMNEGVGPSLYLCPDKQLLEQTRKQAALYGIPVCEVDESNQFPTEFINSKSILLCTFQKLFNGKNIFDRDNIELGAIVIDDAHTCLDIAREATTVIIPRHHELFDKVRLLFEDDFKHQASGTYQRLIDGDPYAKVLKVPYWSWLNKNPEIITLLSQYTEDDILKFKWGLIADDLKLFDCFLGNNGIEIAPIHVPYHNNRPFNEAKHRYILSATFEDQVDLLKDLGISKDSIKNTLIPTYRKDLGQRLILAPRRFDCNISDQEVISVAKDYAKNQNVVVMVPSRKMAQRWEDAGAKIITKENINDEIDYLKSNQGGIYALVNRYDGVDLNGDMCRVLILDGYPTFSSYKQSYSETRLEAVRASLKAQIIEQGLGRSVRSGSDYCVVFLTGKDITQFVGNQNNLKYFTPVTRAQLKLGLSLLDNESRDNSLQTIVDTANLCLVQNEDWRRYHASVLSKVETQSFDDRFDKTLELAEVEASAIELFRNRNYEGAANLILTKIIGSIELTKKQKAWYFELAAQFMFQQNTVKSNDLQLKASQTATNMLHPKGGYSYSKITGGAIQASQVLEYIKQFETQYDFKNHVNDLLDNLKFSPDLHHSKFEGALATVGRLIGFNAQEPEKEFGNGPDVLWVLSDNHYLIIEAKSRAIHDEITRDNIGQLLQSGEWFKKAYGNGLNYNLVTIQPPNIKGWNVNPSDDTRVIDKNSLDLFKSNLQQFTEGVISFGFNAITNEQLAKLLISHNLTAPKFREVYLKKINSKKR
eukprot:TRINITY_DN328493_c0_g2_i2.p1 TRINITY_DN328493_c0_g2~~TRINITY_DN328493_c0_g2_i2.p1  ORF type:complete len:851 (+),score=94.65 TRINITY_DN328493_c0_g2_i2:2563-5115(+)